MVRTNHHGNGSKDITNSNDDGRKDQPTGEDGSGGDPVPRRSVLRGAGLAAAGIAAGAVNASGPASAERSVTQEGSYEVWTISGKEVYDLSDGEELSNVLIDQRADGACLTIRSRNKAGWTVRNVGFLGVGEAGDGGNRFQFQVSCSSGGSGLIENIWMNGKGSNGPGTELGGIYIRASHGGHIDIRHTYIEGFGNNAVYASSVGKDSGQDGSVTIENAYHRDNTSTQFRIGSPGSVVRNSVGVVDDPEGLRGPYPGSSSNQNARGIWGKHFRDQRFENCAFYTAPDDAQPDGVFEARYISGRSHGSEAVAEVVDCHVNADAPTLTGTTSNARINFTNLGETPTVAVIQDGGVPTSAEMAASGGREMPPELPGASGGGGDGSTGDGSDETTGDPSLDRTLTVDGTDADRTDYAFTVSGDLAENPDVGSLGTGDSIDGSSASGFVNGGVDGYRFSGDVTELDVSGDATILIDGTAVDPNSIGDADPTVQTGSIASVTDSSATINGSLDSLGGAASADVAFEWRATGASSWTTTAVQTLNSAGAFSQELTGLSAETTYDYRAVVTASDGDWATGSTVQFTTDAAPTSEPTLDRTLTVDGTDADRTDYAFTVSGDLAENPDVGSLGTGDSIDGSSASGFVNGGVDGYRFSGELADISVDGGATILVDGEPLTGLTLPNTLVFDGSDTTSQTTYEVAVSGNLTSDPTVGGIERGDTIDAGTVAGSVDAGDVDGFRFSGSVVSLRVDGEATVAFEDVDG